jgi:hypothetical protein
MSRFNSSPRERHLKGYLKTFPKGRCIVDTTYPDHSVYPVEDHTNWIDFTQIQKKRSQIIFLLQRDQRLE